ncbi:MAG: 3-phosphoshikimate 1-carboxyvinyltransferase [Spirochaetes bacterium]|nr:3-phosphoshikimate 1-carboxyvinyltransferase [Spirochaetota bacterium]
MKRSVSFKKFSGSISAPPSKSAALRALAIALLKKTDTELYNASGSEDILNTIEVIKILGAEVNSNGTGMIIKGGLDPVSDTVNVGESGLAVRMFSPIVSLLENEICFTGEGSLLKRPVSMVEEPLRMLGVKVESEKGFLPLKIKGPIVNNTVEIDGSISSQFLTGMLISKGETDSVFKVITNNLKSRPYVDLTIRMMSDFGIQVANNDYTEFIIQPGQQYTGSRYTVEGDWSGASFFIAAAAFSGEITITGLDADSAQADIAMLEAVKLAGAGVFVSNGEVRVIKGNVRPFEFDASECPDLFPPLVSLAANINGTSAIKGVHRLKHKESDRGLVLKKEFAKLGIEIIIENDLMKITGGTLKSGVISSNNDHRIAMAGAVAAASGQVKVEITESDAVNKSYSRFYDDIISTGGNVE